MKAGRQSYRVKTRTLISERRAKVAHLYLQEKKTQQQIAQELGFSVVTICEDMKALNVEWRRQAHDEVETHVAVELKKIAQVEQEAHESFQKSKKLKRVASVTKRSSSTGEETVASASQVEREEGDPRFLAIILNCSEKRIKLLGLDKREPADDTQTKHPTTLEDFVAAHFKLREQNVNGTTPEGRPSSARLDPSRLS